MKMKSSGYGDTHVLWLIGELDFVCSGGPVERDLQVVTRSPPPEAETVCLAYGIVGRMAIRTFLLPHGMLSRTC